MKRRSLLGFTLAAALIAPVSGCQSAGERGPGTALSLTESRELLIVGSGAANEQGSVTTYELDRATGGLRQLDRKPVGGTLVSFMAVNPARPVLYATDTRTRRVHWLGLDPATGMLTTGENQFQPASGGTEHLAVDATGTVLVGVNFGTGTADVYPLDPNTGAMLPRTDSISTGRNPHFVEFSPDNRYVYIGSQVDHWINQFSLNDGVLTPLSPPRSPVTAPRQFNFHPNGTMAYSVSGPTDNVSRYRIAENGAIAIIDSVRRMPTDYSGSLNSTGGTIMITPSARFAYVNNRGSNTIAIFSMDPEGRLTPMGQESTRGLTPRHADMDPDGEILVVGNQESQSLAVFRIDGQTGALSLLNTVSIGVSPYYIGIHRFPTD